MAIGPNRHPLLLLSLLVLVLTTASTHAARAADTENNPGASLAPAQSAPKANKALPAAPVLSPAARNAGASVLPPNMDQTQQLKPQVPANLLPPGDKSSVPGMVGAKTTVPETKAQIPPKLMRPADNSSVAGKVGTKAPAPEAKVSSTPFGENRAGAPQMGFVQKVPTTLPNATNVPPAPSNSTGIKKGGFAPQAKSTAEATKEGEKSSQRDATATRKMGPVSFTAQSLVVTGTGALTARLPFSPVSFTTTNFTVTGVGALAERAPFSPMNFTTHALTVTGTGVLR